MSQEDGAAGMYRYGQCLSVLLSCLNKLDIPRIMYMVNSTKRKGIHEDGLEDEDFFPIPVLIVVY